MTHATDSSVPGKKARVLLVDDHAVVRFGISQLINRQADLVVCGEEEDASRAMTAIEKLKPDLVIADISLKDSSGLELMRNIKATNPGLPVLVVSVHDESVYAEMDRTAFLQQLRAYEDADELVLNKEYPVRRRSYLKCLSCALGYYSSTAQGPRIGQFPWYVPEIFGL